VLRIRDVNSGSKFSHPGSRLRIRINNQKIVSKLTEILSGMYIPDPDLNFFYPSRVQGSKRPWIRNTDSFFSHFAFFCSLFEYGWHGIIEFYRNRCRRSTQVVDATFSIAQSNVGSVYLQKQRHWKSSHSPFLFGNMNWCGSLETSRGVGPGAETGWSRAGSGWADRFQVPSRLLTKKTLMKTPQKCSFI